MRNAYSNNGLGFAWQAFGSFLTDAYGAYQSGRKPQQQYEMGPPPIANLAPAPAGYTIAVAPNGQQYYQRVETASGGGLKVTGTVILVGALALGFILLKKKR